MMVSIQEPYDSVVRVLTKLQYRAVKHDLTGVHEAATEVIDLLTTDRKANKDAANAPKNQGGVMSKVNKTSNSVDFDTPKVNTPDNTIDSEVQRIVYGVGAQLELQELDNDRRKQILDEAAHTITNLIAQEANKAYDKGWEDERLEWHEAAARVDPEVIKARAALTAEKGKA